MPNGYIELVGSVTTQESTTAQVPLPAKAVFGFPAKASTVTNNNK